MNEKESEGMKIIEENVKTVLDIIQKSKESEEKKKLTDKEKEDKGDER